METLSESRIKSAQRGLLIGGILVMFTQLAIASNLFSLFVIPICEDLGFARGQFSMLQSLGSLGGAIASFFSGNLFNRKGIVRIMRMGAIGCVLVYMLQSISTQLWQFGLIFFIIGFCNTLSTSMPLALLIGEWFTGNKNTITGIVMTGSGFGSTIFVNLTSSFIINYGWRTAQHIMVVIMAVVILSVDFLLLKEPPKALSAGAEKLPQEGAPSEPKQSVNFFAPVNVIMGCIMAVIAIGVSCSMSPITHFLQDIGYSQSFSAAVYSGVMISSAIGKIFHGIALDKLGVRISCSIMLALAIMGVFATIYFRSPIFSVPLALGVFFVSSLQVVASPAIAEYLVGEENKRLFLGKLNIFISVGYLIGPLLYGALYDHFGTYIPGFWVAIAVYGFSLVAVNILLGSKKQK
ncbi:MAG: MFS transporter [Firmicutes bacterium]|nr:MFS transporter [Bacillota bacterium]